MASSSELAVLASNWWNSFKGPYFILHQLFGDVMLESDLLPTLYSNGYSIRPRTQAWITASGKSEVINNPQKFEVFLDVSHFTINELKVAVYANSVVVGGKHEEKSDEYGFISREFVRRYALPKGCVKEKVTLCLTPNGVLIIQAPKANCMEPPEEPMKPPITKQSIVKEK